MIQVHVITAANRHLYEEEMETFFRLRHEIYVEEKRWREPSADGLEVDQFDTEAATYLIGIEDERIICGSRFITTDRPHLLSEVFPTLCNFYGVIRAPQVAEWTRGFIVKDRRAASMQLLAQSCAAVMEYCLDEGIREVGGIQELYWLPLWRRMKWKVRRVGEEAMIDDQWCLPAFFQVDEAALQSARQWGKIEGSILVHREPIRRLIQPRVQAREVA